MTLKLNFLTPNQAALIPHYKKQWTQKALSTKPADWDRAEASLRACYTQAGLAEPRVIVRALSPVVGCIGAAVAAHQLEAGIVRRRPHALFCADSEPLTRMIYETADKVLEVLKPAKRGLQVNFRAPTHAADKLVESLLNGANISSVAAAIDQTVNVESRRKADLIRFDEGHAFMKRNMNCVRDIVNEMKADSPFTETAKLTAVAYFAGPRWASWAGVERFFVDECGLETQGGPFASLVESCGWVWPHSDFAVIVDHPHSISQSEIVYRDGGHV